MVHPSLRDGKSKMPMNPAFKRWAKFKGRYASKSKMNQYQNDDVLVMNLQPHVYSELARNASSHIVFALK
jgi:hypothetical protein